MGKNTRVLIIDDSAVWRKIIKKNLESIGFNIAGEAVNGQEGINKYLTLKPDLVTMDIEMPVMDGITATQRILEIDGSAKIIMISSKGDENTVRRALLIGAVDFISKTAKQEIWNTKLLKYINKTCQNGICNKIIEHVKKVKPVNFILKLVSKN